MSDKVVYINLENSAGSGGAEWGTITGTLSSQTDLQTELDGKEINRSIVHVTSAIDYEITDIVENAVYLFDTQGTSIVVTIPDTTQNTKHCKFILNSTVGDITIVTSSGEMIGGLPSQLVTTYNKGFEVQENSVGYAITQDSRPSASNISVNFYPTITPSEYDVTYNTLVTELPTESEITTPSITSTDSANPTSLGIFLNDNAALDGIIPETNIIAVGNVSKETVPTADLKFRFKYYEYDIATTTLNPTVLATSEYSATVDSTTTEQKTISAVLPSNDWTGKVLVIELQAYKLSGATNPVMQFISGGTATSKTYLNVPVASINLDSLGGTLSDTKVNLSGSYSGNLSGKTSQKDANDILDAGSFDNLKYFNDIVQKTTSGNALLTDAFKYIHFNSTSAITYTVQTNSTIAHAVGTVIQLTNINTGTVTIAAQTGVTINSKDGALSISGQYGEAVLRKIATNTWILSGSLE